MTNNVILNSDKYVRNGSPAYSPMEYLEPVLEVIEAKGLEWKVSGTHPLEVGEAESEEIHKAYGRVLIETKMKTGLSDAGYTAGMIYALDKNVPEFVAYGGHEVFACTNLCVSAEQVMRVKDSHKSAQQAMIMFLDQAEESEKEYIRLHNTLQNRDLSIMELDTTIGELVRRANTQYKIVGTSPIIHAVKELNNPKSMYSSDNGESNLWKVYNAVTDFISTKHLAGGFLLERPLKTAAVTKMFSELV